MEVILFLVFVQLILASIVTFVQYKCNAEVGGYPRTPRKVMLIQFIFALIPFLGLIINIVTLTFFTFLYINHRFSGWFDVCPGAKD